MDRARLTSLLRAQPGLTLASAGDLVFLIDPSWTPAQLEQVDEIRLSALRSQLSATARGWLMIPTGGTAGAVRFARHDELTISAAVKGFCEHFGTSRVNSVGVLPLHHVSGLMAWLRCAFTNGTYTAWDWKRLESGEFPELKNPSDCTISLVPTQLERLLRLPSSVLRLQMFGTVFVGGAPAWPDLLESAANARIRLSPCYGMTETAAMVTALRPADFLAGVRTCGRAMPHAQIEIGPTGLIRVTGESVFRGYWPEFSERRSYQSPDIGRLDGSGHLRIEGRSDLTIITGGEKVNPAAVEEALRASGQFDDVVVIGIPDPKWGEAVVACYPADGRKPDLVSTAKALADLPAYARPKRIVPIDPWPRNSQGKIDRSAIRQSVSA